MKGKFSGQTKDAILFYLGLVAILAFLFFKYGVTVAYVMSISIIMCTCYTIYSLFNKKKSLTQGGVMGLAINNIILFVIFLPIGFVVTLFI